jgi:hypothetical protein
VYRARIVDARRALDLSRSKAVHNRVFRPTDHMFSIRAEWRWRAPKSLFRCASISALAYSNRICDRGRIEGE